VALLISLLGMKGPRPCM